MDKSERMGITWSPTNQNRFITYGSEIRMYEVDESNSTDKGIQISEDTHASLLAVEKEFPYLRCLAWWPYEEMQDLFAVGQANGTISLFSLSQQGMPEVDWMVGREFAPRHPRSCNFLAWNPSDKHLLAAGYEKHRQESTLLIWDVTSTMGLQTFLDRRDRQTSTFGDTTNVVSKPIAEISSVISNECATSMAWDPHNSNLFVAGFSSKQLRVYDMRDPTKHTTTGTRCINGVCYDPFQDKRFASFSETQIAVWDVRNMESPRTILNATTPLLSIKWCPWKSGLLGTLSRDRKYIRFRDLRHCASVGSNTEPQEVLGGRQVIPVGIGSVVSFSFHPTHEQRLLALGVNGDIKDVYVHCRIAHAWSPNYGLTLAVGRHMTHVESNRADRMILESDVASKIKQRASLRYGLEIRDFSKNGDYVDEPEIKAVWEWMQMVRDVNRGVSYPGVYHVLFDSPEKSARHEKHWREISNNSMKPFRPVYCSQQRFLALQLCGWIGKHAPYHPTDSVDITKINKLVSDRQYERAAALSLFNLNLRSAIDCLKGEDQLLSVVAMALSGFTDNNSGLWQQRCSDLSFAIVNPYLKASFDFLTADVDYYLEFVKRSSMLLQDKIGFACVFLNDIQLRNYLSELKSSHVEKGDLYGMLLTGFSDDGLELLQQYVDRSADLQTAACLCLHCPEQTIVKLPTTQTPGNVQTRPVAQNNGLNTSSDKRCGWVDAYRDLLDACRLWSIRAELDNLFHKAAAESKERLTSHGVEVAQNIFITCSHCEKSVSYRQDAGRRAAGSKLQDQRTFPRGGRIPGVFSNQPANFIPDDGVNMSSGPTRLTSCANCNKSLPRCAICLMSMGASPTSLPSGQGSMSAAAQYPCSSWFTWCQTCHHGGHLDHVTSWFEQHSDCPVTGCRCRCASLDTMPDQGEILHTNALTASTGSIASLSS